MAVKALIHRISKNRFEGTDLTPEVLKYAETNPENFQFIYAGPEDDQAEAIVPEKKTYTASQLRRMNEGAVQDIAMSLGITVDQDSQKSDLIDAILSGQSE